MYFGRPVSTTTHSIPTLGTQSILIYGSSINPSINYELIFVSDGSKDGPASRPTRMDLSPER